MKKCLLFLMIFCMLSGAFSVSAENYYLTDSIALEETRTITIPKPNGEIDEGLVYFTQAFTFVPEEGGTYRFLVDYQDDSEAPYDIYMDVTAPYRVLSNGCEFDAVAGQTYELCFQYPTHDGRYPEFTFYLGTLADAAVPETEAAVTVTEPEETASAVEPLPVGIPLPDTQTLLCCAAAVVLLAATVALLIAERKRNTSSDSL